MSNANKLKANLAWRKRVNEEINAGNVINTNTNAVAFHAAQAALSANLGRTPIDQLPYSSLVEVEQAVPNGIRQRLIQNTYKNAVPKPKKSRRRGTKCCKGSGCTIMGGRRTKRRRNY